MRKAPCGRSWQRNSLSLAVLAALAGMAQALPQGGQVAAGSGNINTAGNAMTVNQSSQKLIVDWQSFGIASGESVQFVQPGADAVALNRVVGNNASEIFGGLSANGQVFLTNPNGILFGPTAQVDVGGLVASTLAISNADFLNGNYVFSGGEGGSVVNQGSLHAADGGVIALLAPEVRNEGLVLARQGAVGLAAGTRVRLDLADGFSLEVEESALNAVIENRQAIRAEGGVILLSATAKQSLLSGMINNTGMIDASSLTQEGGRIYLRADVISQTGTLDASGTAGGAVRTQSRSLLQAGTVSAKGSTGAGGSIAFSADNVVETAAALDDASGYSEGGRVLIRGRDSVYSSGTALADGGTQGGSIDVLGDTVSLAAATLTATGGSGGGEIHVGGDYQGQGPRPRATTTWINAATTLDASATQTGNGGEVIVWSDANTAFAGTARARGGALGGNGGLIEVSGADTLQFAGFGDASAANGVDGTLLLDPKNIFITSASIPTLQVIPLVDPNPAEGDQHGSGQTIELANGNIVQASPEDDFVATDAGAVYMYRQSDGALLSMLTGSSAGDNIGNQGLTDLPTGNFLVNSPDWDNGAAANAGAVTWGNGAAGISGLVGSANSLVGSHTDDQVGRTTGPIQDVSGITVLSNGNYVVASPRWDNGVVTDAGAVTWGDGATGSSGVVGAGNSLVGTHTEDNVGGGVEYLGSEQYLEGGVTALANGNYVVASPFWDNGAVADVGAVTWADGSTGAIGAVTAANSLTGTQAEDRVGATTNILNEITSVTRQLFGGVTALSNGNYVVRSAYWDNGAFTDAGAATWGDGSSGISGSVDAGNSLVGSTASDQVAWEGITALSNGNYVVASALWDNGAVVNAGAATWGDGSSGIAGTIDAGNSLVGSHEADLISIDGITALSNGNYVVTSGTWNDFRGAAAWGDGDSGSSGVVSVANALTGIQAGDGVGGEGVTVLANGNYVVASPFWDNGAAANAGAVTRGNGATGTAGVVSAGNSLVGAQAGDSIGSGGLTVLSNGNYVVTSSGWDNGAIADVGAVTWVSGAGGTTGAVSAANSLVGTQAFDGVGEGGVTALSNGNYVVASPYWNNGAIDDAGAVTWGNGATGTAGVVNAANSLVGSQVDDNVGGRWIPFEDGFSLDLFGGVTPLANGNYVVTSPFWDNGALADVGAVTWANGNTGITGTINAGNSLVGSHAGDFLGVTADIFSPAGMTALPNGDYVIASPFWDNGSLTDAGAVTLVDGDTGLTGEINSSNSLIGTQAFDQVGSGGVTALAGGGAVVRSPDYHTGTGRVDLLRFGSGYPLTGNLLFGDNPGTDVTLTPDQITTILNTGTHLTLQANNDITLNANADIVVNNPGGDGGDFTLQAGRSLFINSDIVTDNGNLTLRANEYPGRGVVVSERDAGGGSLVVVSGVTLDAGSGNIDLTVAGGDYGSGSQLVVSDGLVTGNRVRLLNQAEGGDIFLEPGAQLRATGSGLPLVVGATNGGDVVSADGAAPAQTPNGFWLVFEVKPSRFNFAVGDSDGVIRSGSVGN